MENTPERCLWSQDVFRRKQVVFSPFLIFESLGFRDPPLAQISLVGEFKAVCVPFLGVESTDSSPDSGLQFASKLSYALYERLRPPPFVPSVLFILYVRCRKKTVPASLGNILIVSRSQGGSWQLWWYATSALRPRHDALVWAVWGKPDY